MIYMSYEHISCLCPPNKSAAEITSLLTLHPLENKGLPSNDVQAAPTLLHC